MKISVERVENQENTVSFLRRKDKGKRQFQEIGIMSGVKNTKGEDVVKIVENLTFELEKVNHRDGDEQPVVDGERKKMSSRSYKAIFKKQRRKRSTADANAVIELSIPSMVNINCSEDDTCEFVEGFIEESVKNPETCNSCSKRRRVELDYEDKNLCACKGNISKGAHAVSKDRGELYGNCGSINQGNKSCQRNVDESKCVICKQGGKILRRCNGKSCKFNYHLSCLYPFAHNEPVGIIWHCNQCVMKKIENGVHSVSEGIESVWKVRESDSSDIPGPQMHEYFVKYKGLAHAHNKWVPESQLLLEAPLLVTNFKLKNQNAKWNPDWAIPQKLLKKRPLIMPPEKHDEKTSNCTYEWLVKWRGLDYSKASWELESSSFLRSTDSQRLLKEYEDRIKLALLPSASSNKSIMEPLSKLPAGWQPYVDNASLSIVSKLGEYWRKGKSALFFDEQERAKRIMLYILSFSSLTKPFLIITTSNYLSHWEAEFSRLEPSINVLVYSGDKDNRKGIRHFEFYEEGGQMMFQVLLSSMDAVVEDLQLLKRLKWESIIVDDCQSPRITHHFEEVKTLSCHSKVLAFRAPMKESVIEYHNLLSFLNDSALFDGNLCKLKESLEEYIAYKGKFSKYVEYWLPVQMSNVQLEQYCATLLKNDSASALCSNLKYDPLVAVRHTLFSSRKCCDHPYLVDSSIPTSLTKDLDPVKYLDVGIQASGKLQLLDKILSELKKRQFRVVILYQCIGGIGQDLMGDILDDFLRQRFGQDSYERIDASLKNSRKTEAMSKFNDKKNNRFVFLIEHRACLSTVKLCSVDSIVIFSSDVHPYTDIKALQKTTIESQFQQIKIFRLYSSFTVEEKVLILAKQNIALDSSNANQSSMLLMWGASSLFEKLDEFHKSSITDVSSEPTVLENVFKEFVDVISLNDEIDETRAMIVQVQHDGKCYTMSLPLLGETNIQLVEREKPHVFWSKLLLGRNPRWKFLPSQNLRQRKRGHVHTELPEKIGYENEEVGKKQKKMVSLAKLPEGPNAENVEAVPHTLSKSVANITNTIDPGPASNFLSSDVGSYSPKNLHLQLNSDLLRLCDILKLSDDVKLLVGKFLDYFVESRQVSIEPGSKFQALQISLCWIAASLLNLKMDKKESLALAKNHLQFTCEEEEAESVYSKLRSMKKDFVLRTPNLNSGALNPQLRTIEKKCEKRMAKLIQNQKEEIKEFDKSWDNKLLELEHKHKVEAAVVRTIHHNNVSAMRDKQKRLDEDLKKQKDELQQEKDKCRKDLDKKHLKERLDEKLKVASWLTKASGAADSLEEVLLPSAAENVPHVTIEILSPGTTQTVEMGNADVGKSKDGGKSGAADSLEEVLLPSAAENVPHVTIEILSPGTTQTVEMGNSDVGKSKDGGKSGAADSLEEVLLPSAAENVPHVTIEILSPGTTQTVEMGNADVGKSKDGGKSGAADSLEEVLLPSAAENVPHVTIEILSPGTTQTVEMGNSDVGKSMDGGGSPSVLSLPLVQQAVTSESPFSENVECASEGSQPLDSSRVCGGSLPEAAVQTNEISMAPIEIAVSPNVDGLMISPDEPTIVESSPNNLAPTPSQNSGTPVSRLSLAPISSSSRPTVFHNVTELPQASGHALHLHVDPLHNELDRIRTETEQTVKTYEDMKSKLKSDCNKEIEDVIAKTRKKFEVKFKDAEMAFRSRKKKLDDNCKIVEMNKVLAYAFRSKCLSPSSGPNTKAGLSSFAQHLRRSTVPSAPQTSAAPSAAALPEPSSFTVNQSPVGSPMEATQLIVKATPCSAAISGPAGAPGSSAINGPPADPSPSGSTVVRVPLANSSQPGPPPATAQPPVHSVPRITGITSSLEVKGRPEITDSSPVKGPPVVPSTLKDLSAAISPAARAPTAVPSATTVVKVSTNSSLAGPQPATTKSAVPSATMVPVDTVSLSVKGPPPVISYHSVKDSSSITGSPVVKGPLVVPPAPSCPVIRDPPAIPLTTTQTRVSTTTGSSAVPSTVDSSQTGTQTATSGTTQVKAPTVGTSLASPPLLATPLPDTSAMSIRAATFSPVASPSAATPQVPVPPLQVVGKSEALFSTIPNKTLKNTPITPSTGNHRISGGESCSPAPDLQLFKPPTSMSATKLLVDVDRRSNGYRTSPPLPDLDSNFAPLDLSEFGPPLTTQISLTPSALATDDMVILSDEE